MRKGYGRNQSAFDAFSKSHAIEACVDFFGLINEDGEGDIFAQISKNGCPNWSDMTETDRLAYAKSVAETIGRVYVFSGSDQERLSRSSASVEVDTRSREVRLSSGKIIKVSVARKQPDLVKHHSHNVLEHTVLQSLFRGSRG